ncbi:MAG: F0F1 ATP synthase subunit B [Phycisphaerales bacterium]|nr:F0F1 ATP synthase subunit B [Phycisphaerales bacterium]
MTKKFFIAAATLIMVVLILAPVVLAGGGDESGAHGADKPTLLHWDFGAALWSIIVFVILLIILRIAAWKPILKGLNEREAFTRDSLAQAKKDREEAEARMKEYTLKLDQAREEATAIVEEGRRDAEEVRKRVHAEARSEADAMVARAKKEIEIARDDAVKRLHDQTIMLATSVAGKMIRREINTADHQALLDESLSELERLNA